MDKKIFAGALVFILFFSTTAVSAQTSTPPPGPVYIVQAGDTLWDIAARFNVSETDLMAVNHIPDQTIFPGDQIVIPGLEGLTGTLVTESVPLGESLRSLARKYQVDPELLIKLNHIVSPDQIFAGYNLILLKQADQPTLTSQATLGNNDTLLELAVRQNTDPWTIAQVNDISTPEYALPGDVLLLNGGSSDSTSGAFPAPIVSAILDPLPIIQGATVQVKINLSQEATVTGLLGDHPLHFFQEQDGSQVALQGISAIADTGLIPLRIDATLPDGTIRSFEQMVLLESGNFLTETINGVDPATIDPAVTVPEDAWLLSEVTAVTPEQIWHGMFQMPVDSNQFCVRSRYGNRRTYNEGAFHSFHSGIDYGVCSQAHPFDIYAPADGVVIYTGLKTVRGNVTIIDHGQGIYSGLFHQAEIYVSIGEHVTAGQLIGKIGDTGRVTGPHVHWDLWVNGIQVNPNVWLNEIFPH
jgi:murein DD-endopeptidase MepM/ murein hydrolase activator NlpD